MGWEPELLALELGLEEVLGFAELEGSLGEGFECSFLELHIGQAEFEEDFEGHGLQKL